MAMPCILSPSKPGEEGHVKAQPQITRYLQYMYLSFVLANPPGPHFHVFFFFYQKKNDLGETQNP